MQLGSDIIALRGRIAEVEGHILGLLPGTSTQSIVLAEIERYRSSKVPWQLSEETIAKMLNINLGYFKKGRRPSQRPKPGGQPRGPRRRPTGR